MKIKLLLFSILLFPLFVNAQTEITTADMDGRNEKPPVMKCDNLTTIEKTAELVKAKKAEGYYIFNGGFFELKNEELMPIMVHLKRKTIYHFIVVGQPDLDFLEVALGHDAFGTDEIRDRIRKKRDKTFFTEFTYVPPFEGNYLLSVTEACKGRKKFSTAIYVLIKPNAVTVNE
jgi:hypothetical protein